MVSTDHFRQELLAQLGRAATLGRIDVLINSGELCRSITKGRPGQLLAATPCKRSSRWAIRCFSTGPTVQG
jgi:hypothetical protein